MSISRIYAPKGTRVIDDTDNLVTVNIIGFVPAVGAQLTSYTTGDGDIAAAKGWDKVAVSAVTQYSAIGDVGISIEVAAGQVTLILA